VQNAGFFFFFLSCLVSVYTEKERERERERLDASYTDITLFIARDIE
jgi:hypothetical protein